MKTACFVLLTFLVLCASVFAATDYQCVNDCTLQGYLYSFCVGRCSYSDSAPNVSNGRSGHGIDYKCVSDCTAKRYLYNYCIQACSY